MNEPTFERLVCEYIRAWEAEQVTDAARHAATATREGMRAELDRVMPGWDSDDPAVVWSPLRPFAVVTRSGRVYPVAPGMSISAEYPPERSEAIDRFVAATIEENAAIARDYAATKARHDAERAVGKRAEELGLSDARYVPPSMPGYAISFTGVGVLSPRRLVDRDPEATEAAE